MIAALARAGFQLLPTPQITTHYVLERDGFVALAERHSDGTFGDAGSPGILLNGSFAALIWKKSGPVFVAKDQERPATPAQVAALRRFDKDLRGALGTTGPRGHPHG